MARSKNYIEAKSKVDKNKVYTVAEAVELLKSVAYTKFDGTVELHAIVRKPNVNASVTMPFASGKTKKVEIASDATIEKLKAGKVDFDVLLATADFMPKLVAFAKVLGPKGLMPNPKNGTVIKSEKDAANFSTAAVAVKTEKKEPIIHIGVGKVSQKSEELEANINAVLDATNRKIITKAFLTATMSPSVRISY